MLSSLLLLSPVFSNGMEPVAGVEYHPVREVSITHGVGIESDFFNLKVPSLVPGTGVADTLRVHNAGTEKVFLDFSLTLIEIASPEVWQAVDLSFNGEPVDIAAALAGGITTVALNHDYLAADDYFYAELKWLFPAGSTAGNGVTKPIVASLELNAFHPGAPPVPPATPPAQSVTVLQRLSDTGVSPLLPMALLVGLVTGGEQLWRNRRRK